MLYGPVILFQGMKSAYNIATSILNSGVLEQSSPPVKKKGKNVISLHLAITAIHCFPIWDLKDSLRNCIYSFTYFFLVKKSSNGKDVSAPSSVGRN